MKALKKIKISIFFIGLILFLSGGLFAQSRIGVKLPPYIIQQPSYFKIIDRSFDKTPSEMDKAIYLDTYVDPAAFNSPLVDNVLTTFAQIIQFNQNNMPFFCKMEFQMEQSARFPVKIR
ncbi:MAG: hypothetical protein ACI81W_002536, partial [Saprospiraceae bacterium]